MEDLKILTEGVVERLKEEGKISEIRAFGDSKEYIKYEKGLYVREKKDVEKGNTDYHFLREG